MGLSASDKEWAELRRELDALEATDNSWVIQSALSLAAEVPPEHRETLPADLAVNHDHYLYGAPKQVPDN